MAASIAAHGLVPTGFEKAKSSFRAKRRSFWLALAYLGVALRRSCAPGLDSAA
jgi:hypothetical protein